MTDTTHEAPERIWACPDDERWIAGNWDLASDGMPLEQEYVRADLVQAAVTAALREAAEAVEDYCSDAPDLAGHGHSVGIRDYIFALITPDAQAALDRVVAAERERGFWAGRSCGGSKAEIDAALSAIREGGE